jgi:hypothetical protein
MERHTMRVKMLTKVHPKTITTGPPVSSPKPISKDKEDITATFEKQKEKDMKALRPR